MTKERTTWTKSKRMNEVLRLLRDKDRTIQELCKRIYNEHTSINHRKILRDIEDLRLQEHVIDSPTPERQPKYRLVSSPARAMQPAEALAAHVALRLLYHHTPNPPNSYLDALEKISNTMPEDLRNIAGHSLRPAKNNDKKFGNFEPIANCWTRRHAIAFDYLAMTTRSNIVHRIELEVYFVEASRSNFELYVIGRRRNHEPNEVRTYMMRLMNNVTDLKIPYHIPEDFNPQQYLSNAWGVIGDRNPIIVRLKFNVNVKRWLERDFPGVQKREYDECGNLILTIQTGANNDGKPVELMSWIRGWGANVEILEPKSLKNEWLAEARALIEKFGGED
jgi:CRISPR-associated endonuclease/helicase Cas3